MTITHPCHPLHGKRVQVLCTCRSLDATLIVRFPDGFRAYVPIAWTDLASPPEHDPRTDPLPLLDLDGLRQVVQLIDHMRCRDGFDGTDSQDGDEDGKGAYNETS